MRDDCIMTNTTSQPANRFTFDDALTAISEYALALRSDSTASDSTLDELQYNLDLMLDHDATKPLDATDPDDRLHPDFSTFPSYTFDSLAPELSTRSMLAELDALRTAANALFNTRP